MITFCTLSAMSIVISLLEKTVISYLHWHKSLLIQLVPVLSLPFSGFQLHSGPRHFGKRRLTGKRRWTQCLTQSPYDRYYMYIDYPFRVQASSQFVQDFVKQYAAHPMVLRLGISLRCISLHLQRIGEYQTNQTTCGDLLAFGEISPQRKQNTGRASW